MTVEMSKSKFKAQALEVFREIERTGEPVIITDRGVPALVIRKHSASSQDARSLLAGSVLRYDDPFAPAVEAGDWEALA
jgi:PHD/YefM family antitoxin component YafN of YafNO toxin-antitoxin module